MALLGTIKNSFYILVILFLFACENNKKIQTPVVKKEIIEKKVDVPTFNADSAYFFVEQQVLFGPRAPNSLAHQKCGNYLVSKLEEYGAKMFIQESVEQRFDGEKLNMKNIIGSFLPEKNERIFLCAHWDSRFVADHDTIRIKEPIDGANDGASGVGVLLEIARQISIKKPEIGVDIIFFDLEDQGEGGTGDVLS